MPAEFLDARQRDERRLKWVAIGSFFMFVSVLAAYVMQWLGYFNLTVRF